MKSKLNSDWMYIYYPSTAININNNTTEIIKKTPQITINNAASQKGTDLLNEGHNYNKLYNQENETFISNNNIYLILISLIFILFIIKFL